MPLHHHQQKSHLGTRSHKPKQIWSWTRSRWMIAARDTRSPCGMKLTILMGIECKNLTGKAQIKFSIGIRIICPSNILTAPDHRTSQFHYNQAGEIKLHDDNSKTSALGVHLTKSLSSWGEWVILNHTCDFYFLIPFFCCFTYREKHSFYNKGLAKNPN